MAKFLTTNGISYYIEEIIREAKSEIILLSPYLRISTNLYERLKDADRKCLKITLIYGKDDLSYDQKEMLLELRNLDLYFYKNLHAKCYFNEDSMLVTSMNIHEFSEKNNREMGIFLSRSLDEEVYVKVIEEVSSIKFSSELIFQLKKNDNVTNSITNYRLNGTANSENNNKNNHFEIDGKLLHRLVVLRSKLASKENVTAYSIFETKNLEQMALNLPQTPEDFLKIEGVGEKELEKYGPSFLKEIRNYCNQFKREEATKIKGFCIHCGKKIDYDLSKLYCTHCYNTWAQYIISNTNEKYCHKCGKQTDTSKEKPVCYQCFKNGS